MVEDRPITEVNLGDLPLEVNLDLSDLLFNFDEHLLVIISEGLFNCPAQHFADNENIHNILQLISKTIFFDGEILLELNRF